ncbi:hypothetical protein ACCM60_18865 [Pseudomonas chlororaphis subsp. aureofaciens]|uniref:hypothetical protein n=1 Tax=Pseudomonas chlororaphis TaxID=587753 RepID=UPI0035568A3D
MNIESAMEILVKIFSNMLLLAVVVFVGRRVYDNLTYASRIAKATPTLAQYLRKYPQCKTPRGIQCIVCNSMTIRNWGFAGPGDPRRLFICNQCNTRLYRTENW